MPDSADTSSKPNPVTVTVYLEGGAREIFEHISLWQTDLIPTGENILRIYGQDDRIIGYFRQWLGLRSRDER